MTVEVAWGSQEVMWAGWVYVGYGWGEAAGCFYDRQVTWWEVAAPKGTSIFEWSVAFKELCRAVGRLLFRSVG